MCYYLNVQFQGQRVKYMMEINIFVFLIINCKSKLSYLVRLCSVNPTLSYRVLNSNILVLLFVWGFKKLTFADLGGLLCSQLFHNIWHYRYRYPSIRRTDYRCRRRLRIALVNMYIWCKAGILLSTREFEISQPTTPSRLCQLIIDITPCENVWRLF